MWLENILPNKIPSASRRDVRRKEKEKQNGSNKMHCASFNPSFSNANAPRQLCSSS
jgi:hypothetical protein